jgi:hypothetical protein
MYRIIGGDQKEYGPVTGEELQQWIAEGRLNGQSLAVAEGSSNWGPLASFPEFSDALNSQTAARPPVSATPVRAAEVTNETLARDPELRIGECLSYGLDFFRSNLGFVVGAVTLAWLLDGVMMFLPFIGGILHWLLSGVLMGGLYLACLRRARGEFVSAASVFDGFRYHFVQLMLAGALTKLLSQLGLLVCILPGVYLLIGWLFVLPLVADKRMEFWSAMELSRKVVTRVWFQVLLLMLVAFLPYVLFQSFAVVKMTALFLDILGNVDFDPLRAMTAMQDHAGEIVTASLWVTVIGQIVLLLSLFYAVGVIVRAYENLFGTRKP